MVEKNSAYLERLNLYVARDGKRIAIITISLAVIFLLLAFVLFSAPVETQTIQDTAAMASVEVKDYAEVSNNTTLFQKGQIISERDVYPLESAPDIRLEVKTNISGSVSSVKSRLSWKTVVYSAREKNEVLWSRKTLLDNNSTSSDSVSLNTSVNLISLAQFESQVRDEYGPDIRIEHTLLQNTTLSSNGIKKKFSNTGKVNVYSSTYSVPDLSGTHTLTETKTSQVISPGKTYSVGSWKVNKNSIHFVFISIVLLSAGISSYIFSRRLSLDEARANLTHSRYSVYITEVDGPISCGEPDEKASSLRELVDYSINTNNQIIYGALSGIYYVENSRGDVIAYDPTGAYSNFDEFSIAFDLDEEVDDEIPKSEIDSSSEDGESFGFEDL